MAALPRLAPHRFAFAARRAGLYVERTRPMLKAIVKTIALLAILFVMLYVGMHNPHPIDFQFPVLGTTAKAPLRAPAALIFFTVFAVGLLAGTILSFGGGKGGRKSGGGKDR